VPHAPRKGPVRMTLDDCGAMASLVVKDLQARGWNEASSRFMTADPFTVATPTNRTMMTASRCRVPPERGRHVERSISPHRSRAASSAGPDGAEHCNCAEDDHDRGAALEDRRSAAAGAQRPPCLSCRCRDAAAALRSPVSSTPVSERARAGRAGFCTAGDVGAARTLESLPAPGRGLGPPSRYHLHGRPRRRASWGERSAEGVAGLRGSPPGPATREARRRRWPRRGYADSGQRRHGGGNGAVLRDYQTS